MEKHLRILVGILLAVACSCQREALLEMEDIAPAVTIDEDLQQYGEEIMQNKEGAILAVDPSTGAVLASVLKTDSTDSLKILALVEKYRLEGFPNVSSDEVEAMWRDVNGAPGTGARFWVAHVDGLNICGKVMPITAKEFPGAPVFLAFAPKDNPRIAVLTSIKGSLNAVRLSVPIGSLMIERYLGGETTRPDLEQRMKKAQPTHRRTMICGTYQRRQQNAEKVDYGQ